MSPLTWPAQQIAGHVESYCAANNIRVLAEESDPRGAVCLTFEPVGLDTPAARLRVERHLPFIRQAILDGGWELIPAGVAPFYGVAVMYPGYRLEQHKGQLLLLRALITSPKLDFDLFRQQEALAKAAGYYCPAAWPVWQRTIHSRDLVAHKKSVGFPVEVLKSQNEIYGVMVAEETVSIPIDPTVRAGKTLAALRKTFGGGRAKVMRMCKWCDADFSARELRTHLARCPQNPRAQTSSRSSSQTHILPAAENATRNPDWRTVAYHVPTPEQAREPISVNVKYTEGDHKEIQVLCFVSPAPDRTEREILVTVEKDGTANTEPPTSR